MSRSASVLVGTHWGTHGKYTLNSAQKDPVDSMIWVQTNTKSPYIQYLSKEFDIFFCSITHINSCQLLEPWTVLESADWFDLPELVKVKEDRSISKECLILDFVFDLD